MKKYLALIVIVGITIFSLNAQTLKIQISDSLIAKPEYLWLKIYIDGIFIIKDSVIVSDQNKTNIKLNIGNYIGYAELLYAKNEKSGLGFIYNYKERDFLIKFTAADFEKGELTFLNSIENLKSMQLLEVKKQSDATFIELKAKYLKQSRFDSFAINKLLSYERNFELLADTKNKLCDSIIKRDTFLFTKTIADFIQTPTANSNKQLKKYFDNYDAMLHWHYFDAINFSNPLILNHPAYNSKIEEYFIKYCDKNSFEQGIDVLMKKVSVNDLVKNYTFNYLIDYFLVRKQDALISYLNEKYSNGCGLKLNAEKLNEFTSILQTQVGAKIPDIILYDNKNEIHSLYNEAEKYKYTLIYVWTSWCHACQKQTPKILEITDAYKKMGLGIFAISLDEKKEEWLLAIQKYKTNNWINVAELTSIQKSTILPKFNIRTTPKIFLVDKNGIIVTKDILEDKLKDKLDELLK